MPSHTSVFPTVPLLRTARVVGVREQTCDVWSRGDVISVGFAPMFPSPRVERVSPGHLVAVATRPDGLEAVMWRWYDAVVLGASNGSVRMWEPDHGHVLATPRISYTDQEPGTRAFASAGLPGAEWWVNGPAHGISEEAEVDLDEVADLYSSNNLWPAAFGPTA